jgi:hypothetical protein
MVMVMMVVGCELTDVVRDARGPQTLESHVMVFRAEKARKENVVSSMAW